MTVTVKKVGGSVSVVIPRGVAREMALTEGTALDVTTVGGAIVMRKRGCPARRPLAGIVAQISPAAYRKRNREMADGGPVGREVW
jgi:antitoxin component of MazEF toxin-antitoxin module